MRNQTTTWIVLAVAVGMFAIGASTPYWGHRTPVTGHQSPDTRTYTLSLSTPPFETQGKPAFVPRPPRYLGDTLTCADEIGTPGQVGFTTRSWKPRSDGMCYSADAIR